MNSIKKTRNFFIVQTIIGFIAIAFIIWGQIPDDYRLGLLYGVAASFSTTGVLGIFNSVQLLKNPKKAQQIEIVKNEERTIFIREKARSTTYIIMLYGLAISALVTGFLNHRILSMTLAVLIMIQGSINLIALGIYAKKY